jgi:cytidylate kinase
MSRSVPVLTIDGPSGSGKGTVARRVADALGWYLLDSGALYRLVGLAAEKQGKSEASEAGIAAIARHMDICFEADAAGNERILLHGEDVSRDLRTEECGRLASRVAVLPLVRKALAGVQQSFRKPPGLVADGRDMGTQVFPDADLKVYLTASAAVRAKRRYKQLKDKGIGVSLAALSRDIEDRDKRDTERLLAPLRPAADARVLDSSNLTIDEVTRTVLEWARETYGAN